MLDNVFRGIFDTDMTQVISVSDFLLCVGSSLVIGLIVYYLTVIVFFLFLSIQSLEKRRYN